MTCLMTAADIIELFKRDFPQIGPEFGIESVAPMKARVRWSATEADLRPGGTLSGPTMFTLADLGVYVAVLAMIGPKALAVTTSAHIDFMRKPRPHADLIADVRLHKLGRALAVGDVLMTSEGDDAVVARASLTYSIPPKG